MAGKDKSPSSFPSTPPPVRGFHLPKFLADARERGRRELSAIDGVAWDAVSGKAFAASRFSDAYRSLVQRLRSSPDQELLALGYADTALFSDEAKWGGAAVGALVSALQGQLTAEVRIEMLKAFDSLGDHPWADKLEGLDVKAQARFMHAVATQALRSTPGSPLEEIAEIFHLTNTELAALFGLKRQSLEHWMKEDKTPSSRLPDVYAVRKTAKLLEANLKPGRVPAIVRRPTEWFSNISILDAIGEARYEEVLARVKSSFDWGRVA